MFQFIVDLIKYDNTYSIPKIFSDNIRICKENLQYLNISCFKVLFNSIIPTHFLENKGAFDMPRLG